MSFENEEKLYDACMNFCKAFFLLLAGREKRRIVPLDELNMTLSTRFENDRFKHYFDELYEAVDNIKELKMVDTLNRFEVLDAFDNTEKRIKKAYGYGKITEEEKCMGLRTLNSLKEELGI